MINLTFDEDKKAIFNPEDAYHFNPEMPEVCLVTFTKHVIDIVKERFELKEIDSIDGEEENPIYKFNYKGKDMAIYRVTMGASGTVALMEEARAMGAKKFVYFGSCGTLDQSIPASHIIVPYMAYRDEGTSYHYMSGAGQWVEIGTCDVTAEIIKDLGLPVLCCKTWTTDGLYRETRRNFEKRVKQGCKVVDMECSAIHACEHFREDIRCYQFFYAEDNLDAIEWDPRICGHTPRSSYEMCLDIALEIGARV